MSRRYLAMLLALAAIWGASFMFIRVAVRQLDPVTLVWIRIVLAALVIVPVALLTFRGSALAQARAAAGRVTVMGLVNSVLPFTLIAWAETRIDSSLTAILQATAPLFTALILVCSGGERVGGSRLVGLLLGFVGVAVLVGDHTGGSVLAAFAVILAALCYATAGVFGARRLRDVEPILVAAGSLTAAALVTTPLGLTHLPGSVPGWKELSSSVVLGVVGTGVAYVLFFALLRGVGASRSILVTYLVPPAAVAYGAILLGEPVEIGALAGLALILAGVGLAARGRATRRVVPVEGTRPLAPVRSESP